ncbi:MAG: phage major capsid protein [candidate division Zixibacteria bacterium]|nr:phage major capsid protein [candidate division Zixibacteria bacterium]
MDKIEYRSTSGPYKDHTLGDFLVDVRMAGTPGQQPPQRLYEARATGLSEGVGSEGGFLVQEDFTNQLIKSIFETGVLAEFCMKLGITGPSNSIKINCFNETSRATGSRLGGVQGYWLAEAAQKTASKPDFRQLVLELKKMIGLCYVTDELLQDVAALERIVRQGFADEFGFMLDDSIVNGTGSGRPLGILNSPCLVTVNKETGQAAATIQVENLLKMWARCTNPEKAHWLVNRDIIPQLYSMGITVGTGGSPIFMPAGGISGQPFNTILGRPVIAIEQAQTLGTAGDIILADLSAYILADKGGVQVASSIHVRFVYDESCFRFVYRVDGQPLYASAITPYKGAATLSPFVVLESR